MKYKLYINHNNVTEIDTTDDGITYTGLDKVRAWIQDNLKELMYLQAQVENLQKLSPRDVNGETVILHNWDFKDKPIEIIVKQPPEVKYNNTKNVKIKGVTISPYQISFTSMLMFEYPMRVILDYDTETREEQREIETRSKGSPTEFLCELADINGDIGSPTCDPIKLHFGLLTCEVEVSVLNDDNQPVGKVSLVNANGKFVIAVSDSEQLTNDEKRVLIKPNIQFELGVELESDRDIETLPKF